LNPNGSATQDRAGEIELEHVVKAFGEVTAVSNVSFTIRGGGSSLCSGPSGCGKTTTLRLIPASSPAGRMLQGARSPASRRAGGT
jgi:ABC-type branched-subunit amino acid transport system ATPase component